MTYKCYYRLEGSEETKVIDIIPEGFSAAAFLGALYEINREERCETLFAATFTDCNHTLLKFDEVIASITDTNTHI